MGLWSKLFGPPDRDAFARTLTRALRAGGIAEPIDYDPADYKLVLRGPAHHVLYLTNAYAEYAAASRRDGAAVVQKYVALAQAQSTAGAADEDETFESAKANLLPRVQSRFYHENVRMAVADLPRPAAAEGAAPPRVDNFVHRPFTDHLALDLVLDLPHAIKPVTAMALEGWGVSFDAALAIARDNLWRRSNEQWEEITPGVHLSPWRDTHDASRLFLHDLVWQLPVKGRHVAIAPNRILLAVTGDEDEAGLLALARIAQQAADVDRPISGVPVRLDGTRWHAWLPPAGHPAHWPHRKLAIRSEAGEYAEQADALQRAFAKAGEDVFVAKLSVVEAADGAGWFTWAVWPDNVTDALLPHAQWLAMSRGDRPAGWARIDRALEVAGDLTERTEHHPPRYRVRRFPTDDQLRRMALADEPHVH